MENKVKIKFEVNGITYDFEEIQEDALKNITLSELVSITANNKSYGGILRC